MIATFFGIGRALKTRPKLVLNPCNRDVCSCQLYAGTARLPRAYASSECFHFGRNGRNAATGCFVFTVEADFCGREEVPAGNFGGLICELLVVRASTRQIAEVFQELSSQGGFEGTVRRGAGTCKVLPRLLKSFMHKPFRVQTRQTSI